jgi:molybdate transport system substrate-binding protein
MRKSFFALGCITLVIIAASLRTVIAGDGDKATESGRQLTVAAAADLKFALDDINKEFAKVHPGIEVRVSYGSSGNFFTQLSNKAPFDIFLSADIDYPKKLVEQKFARESNLFQYAVGRIVVWTPKDTAIDVQKMGIKALLDPAAKKIAIANPKHAPYGRAAEAALKNLKILDQVKEKLVLGENVAQTAQYVESGAADIGIIALSLAMSSAMKDKGKYWEVPLESYPRMDQGGVILSWAKDVQAADAYRAFLTSEPSRIILKRYGFFMPEK